MGWGLVPWSWDSTAPIALPEASVVMMNGLSGSGYCSMGALAIACLRVANAACCSGPQTNLISFFRSSVSGAAMWES